MKPTSNYDHFVHLARRGKHPGASGAEARCYNLAKAALDNINGIDNHALHGFLEFIIEFNTNSVGADNDINR
ncbi:MAG: hypothetical protein ACREUY_09735 [Burkholderiales bacterium]